MKRILLIGSTSLIGQSLLKSKEYEFVCPQRQELDLTLPASIDNFNFKKFDCLIFVAGAGMRHGRKFTFEEDEVDADYIKNTIDVNCTGATLLLKQYLKHNNGGHVVVIGSVVVNDLKNTNVVYASSKTYLDRMVDLLDNLYTQTTFIKINPGVLESRREKNLQRSVSADTVADLIWKAIAKNIKRIDVYE